MGDCEPSHGLATDVPAPIGENCTAPTGLYPPCDIGLGARSKYGVCNGVIPPAKAPIPGAIISSGWIGAFFNASSSSTTPKSPVPIGASWPSMIFSETPLQSSNSAAPAASIYVNLTIPIALQSLRNLREPEPRPLYD
jgi:hypothetical protein